MKRESGLSNDLSAERLVCILDNDRLLSIANNVKKYERSEDLSDLVLELAFRFGMLLKKHEHSVRFWESLNKWQAYKGAADHDRVDWLERRLTSVIALAERQGAKIGWNDLDTEMARSFGTDRD
jgi:hypothetical protein